MLWQLQLLHFPLLLLSSWVWHLEKKYQGGYLGISWELNKAWSDSAVTTTMIFLLWKHLYFGLFFLGSRELLKVMWLVLYYVLFICINILWRTHWVSHICFVFIFIFLVVKIKMFVRIVGPPDILISYPNAWNLQHVQFETLLRMRE